MQRPPLRRVSRHHRNRLCLCAGADLGEGLLDLVAGLEVYVSVVLDGGACQIAVQHRASASPICEVTHLLPQLHDLEPLEVVQLPPLLERSALLGPGALVELLLDLVLLPLLRNVADTGGTGQLGDDDRGERELGEGDFLTGNGGLLGGTINKDLLL